MNDKGLAIKQISPGLFAAYQKSFSILSPQAIRTVREWQSAPVTKSIKVVEANEEINEQFTEIITAITEIRIYANRHTMIVGKKRSPKQVRFEIQNIPSRRQIGRISKDINDLGKELAPLNVNSSYLIADALERLKVANEMIYELENLTMARGDYINPQERVGERRRASILQQFKDFHSTLQRELDQAVVWLKVSEKMWNRVGAIEKWKSMLRDLERTLNEYEILWEDKWTAFNRQPTFEEYAGDDKTISKDKSIRGKLAEQWLEILEYMPESMRESEDADIISGWFMIAGKKRNRPYNPMKMIKEVRKAIKNLLVITANKAFKSWLSAVREIRLAS